MQRLLSSHTAISTGKTKARIFGFGKLFRSPSQPLSKGVENNITIQCREIHENDQRALWIDFEEDQTGLLAEITNIAFELGWNITSNIEVRSVRHGHATSTYFPITKNPSWRKGTPDLKALIKAIEGIQRRRGYRQPVRNGRSRFLRVRANNQPGEILSALAAQGMNVVSIRAPTKLNESDPQTWEFITEGPDTRDETGGAALDHKLLVALKPLAFQPESVELAQTEHLIRISTVVEEDPDQKNCIRVTVRTNEDQAGILKDFLLEFKRHKINDRDLTYKQVPLPGKDAKIEFVFPNPHPHDTALFNEWKALLEARLGTIRRFPGERGTQPGSLRGMLHLSVPNESGAMVALLNELEKWRINIDLGVIQSKADNKRQSWELGVSAPETQLAGLKSALATLELSPGQKLVSEPDVFWNINGPTALATRRLFENAMDENPERRDKYIERMKGEREVLVFDKGPVDRGFIADIKNAFALAKEFHANQTRDDGSPYFVHLLETAYTLLVYVGQRDPIYLIAAILHDAIEDGPREYLKKTVLDKKGKLKNALLMIQENLHGDFPDIAKELNKLINSPSSTDIEREALEAQARVVLQKWIKEKIRRTFPHHPKLLGIIETVTHEQAVHLRIYLKAMTDPMSTVWTGNGNRNLKLIDRTMNLKDVRLLNGGPEENYEKQADKVAETLQHYLPLVSWKPEVIDETYIYSSQLFLTALMEEVAHTSESLWKERVAPPIRRTADFQDQVMEFGKWMDENPECMPEVPFEIRDKFGERLDSLMKMGGSTSGLRTSHLPLEVWRLFKSSLVQDFMMGYISRRVFERVLQGDGAARLENGRVTIEEESLFALTQAVNRYRHLHSLGWLSESFVRFNLERHERLHQDAYLRPHRFGALLQQLKGLSYIYSPFRSFEGFQEAFIKTYGDLYYDERVFVEELWVLFQTEEELLGNPVQLIHDPDQEDVLTPLPSDVTTLLARFVSNETRFEPAFLPARETSEPVKIINQTPPPTLTPAAHQSNLMASSPMANRSIDRIIHEIHELDQGPKGIDETAARQLQAQLRGQLLREGLELALTKTPWDRSLPGEVQINDQSTEVVLGELQGQVHWIRIGSFYVVDRTFIPRELAALIEEEPIVLINGPVSYANYLVPVLAQLLEMKSALPGATVVEDGIGTGVLGLTALRFGARRLVGIDSSHRDLESVDAVLREHRSSRRATYHGRILSASEWPNYQPSADDDYLLIADDLRHWYAASTHTREQITGGGRIIRLANLGPHYPNIFEKLLKDVLRFSETVILGGFLGNDLTPELLPFETAHRLGAEKAFDILIKPYQVVEKFGDGLKFYSVRAQRLKRVADLAKSA